MQRLSLVLSSLQNENLITLRLVGISGNSSGLRYTKSNQIRRCEKIDSYTIAAVRAAIQRIVKAR